jgi:branched-chain amino acid transport system substrate-binding protein
MARRTLLGVAAGVMAVALGAAACGSSGGSSGGGGGGKKTYTIGFQGVLSGDNQQLGINALDGVKTAVDEANKDSSLPFSLKLVQSDDAGSPDQGPTAAQQLIDNSGVLAVVGPMFSSATKASEGNYTQAGLLSVSPSATNPTLTSSGFKTFFRVINPDTTQGKADADYIAKGLKAKTVFSLDDKSDYGTGLSGALAPELKAQGVTVTHDGINPTKDYTSEATKIIAAKPDVLFYSGYYAELALLTKALKAAGFTGKIMSGDGSKDPAYVTQAGAANAEGAYLTCACGDASADPSQAAFVKSFEAVNPGAKPGTYSAEAYDAVNAIIQALKKVGGSASRSSVLSAFAQVDFKGITKQIKFQPNGEDVETAVYINQVKNGKITQLGKVADLIKS